LRQLSISATEDYHPAPRAEAQKAAVSKQPAEQRRELRAVDTWSNNF